MNNARIVSPLFPVVTSAPSAPLTSPRQLTLWSIELTVAKSLNWMWHSQLPRIGDPNRIMEAGMHFGSDHDGIWYAVAIWTHPVARLLPQDSWLELRRLAIAADAPRYTATWMMGRMVRFIRRHRPKIINLISYQDTEVHTGTIYRAAGWQPTTMSGGDEWDRPGRSRPKSKSSSPKQRWELSLRKEVKPC